MCRFRCSLQASAARNLHADDGYAFDIVVANDSRQLLTVVHRVQFGAADDRDLALHEILMHIGIGIGGAICRDQELCAIEERCLRR